MRGWWLLLLKESKSNHLCNHVLKHQSSGSQKITFRTKQIGTVFTAWRLHSISHKCKVTHFTGLWSKVEWVPTIRIFDTLLPVDDSTKSLAVWRNSHISSKKQIGGLKPVQWCPQSHPSGCTLKMGRGQRCLPDALQAHCSLRAGPWFALCMIQNRIPPCDDWTASKILD